MKSVNFPAVLCGVVLLAVGCRKEEPAALPRPVPEEADAAPLSTMSRKQREAHRILETVTRLEEALAALTALEGKGLLTWKAVPTPDLAAMTASLSSVRAQVAQSEAEESKGHSLGRERLNSVFQQVLQLSQQTDLPEGAVESRTFAAALISASDEMDTTTPLEDNRGAPQRTDEK